MIENTKDHDRVYSPKAGIPKRKSQFSKPSPSSAQVNYFCDLIYSFSGTNADRKLPWCPVAEFSLRTLPLLENCEFMLLLGVSHYP